jgi:hypothetical protein
MDGKLWATAIYETNTYVNWSLPSLAKDFGSHAEMTAFFTVAEASC